MDICDGALQVLILVVLDYYSFQPWTELPCRGFSHALLKDQRNFVAFGYSPTWTHEELHQVLLQVTRLVILQGPPRSSGLVWRTSQAQLAYLQYSHSVARESGSLWLARQQF